MYLKKTLTGQQIGSRLGWNSHAALLLQDFFATVAHGLIEAQEVLDERGRESIITWEQEGLPPTVLTWADCRLHFPVAFRSLPKTTPVNSTQLAIAPRKDCQGRLTLTIRYILTSQAEEP